MRTLLPIASLLACICFAQSGYSENNLIAIQGASVVDGTGAPARMETVLIRDGRIEAVGDHLTIPAGARVIDASGETLLPGLFDLHTHIHSSAANRVEADWGKSLAADLACGVTSINDFSSYGEMFSPIRRLVASGTVEGPNVNFAVRISTPGGHGTESGRGSVFTLQVNTPESAHAAMQKALAYKPNVIKVFTDGWRYGSAPDLSSMNEATLAAIVEDAHKAGIKVFTHTVTLQGAKIAARAGVDSLAHGIGDAPIDDELISLMKKSHTAYVSTLAVFEPRLPTPADPVMLQVLAPGVKQFAITMASSQRDPAVVALEERRWHFLQANVKKIHDAGIPIGIGTDAGMPETYHGWSTLREIELMVDSGLTPLEALTAATSVSVRLEGGNQDRGTIESGKIADLLLVKGRPDEHIRDIEHTQRVFLAGSEVNLTKLRADIQSKDATTLPSRKVASLIDDFESTDGRSEIGTLPVDRTDLGVDHSKILVGPVLRPEGGHADMVTAHMAAKDAPYVRLEIPLTPGGVEPADISNYQGVSFEVRGDGNYRMRVETYGGPDLSRPSSSFEANSTWHVVRVPLSALRANNRTADPHEIQAFLFELARPAGSDSWLEIDNVRMY